MRYIKAPHISTPHITAPQFAKNIWVEVRDYIFIALALCIYAVGLTLFLLPYEITTGGITGVSAIVFYATGLEVQYTYLAINIVFLMAAVFELGWKFCLKTIYAVSMLTFILWALQRIIEMQPGVEAGQLPPLMPDRFMSCVIGGILEGGALAICFLNNGSTGGTDIIAAIVNKYKNVSLGNVILFCDIIIISSSYLVFQDEPDCWERVICGLVTLSISAFTLDYVINRQRQSVQFMIFSRNYSKIADAINATGRGVTVLDGQGWYTKTERKVIVCLTKRRESINIFRMIKSIDPYCFVSMANAQGVYGEGFDKIKAKSHSKRRTVVFATNNQHKLEEVQQILGDQFEVRSLDDIGCHVDIPETGKTFRENALQKAQFVKKYYGFDCFADDSGLECDALDGAPGVLSARYAGADHDSEANMQKLLTTLGDTTNRKAAFRTVIAFVTNDDTHYFEGVVQGNILTEKRGSSGFGYDPIFQPDGYDKTFAEMSSDEKNTISHRGQAVEKLAKFLLAKK